MGRRLQVKDRCSWYSAIMWGSNPYPPIRSNYAVCLQAVYVLAENELPVKCCKPDSAMHSTKNIIANRLMAVLGKRQRLAVLRLTVNQFPSGKHCRFNSYLPHLNMITSVQMDFSILPRRMVMSCSNSRYWIDWQLLLESDFKQEDRNYQQFCVVYHHREVKSRILVADE